MKTNCYSCKHRKKLEGDAHSKCCHPKVDGGTGPLSNLIGLLAIAGRVNVEVNRQTILEMGIKMNEVGVKRGWCNWPLNFDPIWIENCDAIELKGGV